MVETNVHLWIYPKIENTAHNISGIPNTQYLFASASA